MCGKAYKGDNLEDFEISEKSQEMMKDLLRTLISSGHYDDEAIKKFHSELKRIYGDDIGDLSEFK